jgi:hypothetical protein
MGQLEKLLRLPFRHARANTQPLPKGAVVTFKFFEKPSKPLQNDVFAGQK